MNPENKRVSPARRMWRKLRSIGDDSLFWRHYATLRTAAIGPLVTDWEMAD